MDPTQPTTCGVPGNHNKRTVSMIEVTMEYQKIKPEMLLLNIHGMSCTNKCAHCWTYGSPGGGFMAFKKILDLLMQLRSFQECSGIYSVPLFFSEPTIHPDFERIIESMNELGFINENTFWATNGAGLARKDDAGWQRLKDNGFNRLQFTVYGLQQDHDRFAGRGGAFDDLVAAIKGAQRNGLSWYVGAIAHAGNAEKLDGIMDYFNALDDTGKTQCGWFVFSHQGRGRSLQKPTYRQLQEKLSNRKGEFWKPEREWVGHILGNPELANRGCLQDACKQITYDVEPDFSVFFGGNCDNAGLAGVLPSVKKDYYAGNIKQEPFQQLYDRGQGKTTLVEQLLGDMTWGRLAERYGNRENDEIFFLHDLVMNKWGGMCLQDHLGK